ncbi:MAG: uroporphyrinogen-III synthase [Thermoplasmata archaeon]
MEEHRPRLAIFRPKEKLGESIRLAEDRGYEVLAVPMLETRAYDDPKFLEFLKTLEEGEVGAVVFTGSNGVVHAFRRARRTMGGEHFRDALNRTRVVAIGPATKLALRNAGVASKVPVEHSSGGLVEYFARKRISAERVALLRSRQGSALLSEGLRSRGHEVMDVTLYEVGLPTDQAGIQAFFDRVVRGDVDVFAFLSSMTVSNFLEAASALGVEDEVRAILSQRTVAAIGEPTKETLEKEGIRVSVKPREATFEDLLDAIGRNA